MPMPRSSKSRGVIGKRPILNRKRDLVAEVQQLAKSFTTLCQKFNQSQEKYRDGLYKFAAECYSSGRRLINDRVECERFWRQPFWKGVHKAPKRDEVMKAVMMVAMDTNSRPYLRKRAEKTGKVLQSFSEDEVEPDEVVERLKEGGGIEKMYRERAEPGGNTPIPDDLDLLKPDLPDPPEEDKDYNPFQAARDGTFVYEPDDAVELSDVDSGRPVESEEGSDRHSGIDHAMMLGNVRQSAPAKQICSARFNQLWCKAMPESREFRNSLNGFKWRGKRARLAT
jgi:hypothetical protein